MNKPSIDTDFNSTIHYKLWDGTPTVSRAKIVMDLDDEIVFHLPDDPIPSAVKIDKRRMLGTALINSDEISHKRVELCGMRRWKNPFEVQVLFQDTSKDAWSVVNSSGGISKKLGRVNQESATLNAAETHIDLHYTGDWNVVNVEPGRRKSIDIDIIDEPLDFDGWALALGSKRRFDQLRLR